MTRLPINDSDYKLIQQARDLIALRHKPDIHAVSSVLRTKAGNVFEGIHLEAYIGRIAVCAEAVTIGTAATQGDSDIDSIVAVYHTGKIVAPCGMCRELISDYASDALIILEDNSGIFKTPVLDLLPMKYERE
ncbi:cytidine deaminase [Spirosoma pollinicola]|uniref:Cytidine deaminase n=1 Tax=Spirosoma pollinicola TaxID=2057025 RepID=A0A2K8YTP1_9BACT|nr:cytidine deaminase [Spirosoma pollinicola]AUD01005.1 cytidine deaminase [Spirosoma pollinicola]